MHTPLLGSTSLSPRRPRDRYAGLATKASRIAWVLLLSATMIGTVGSSAAGADAPIRLSSPAGRARADQIKLQRQNARAHALELIAAGDQVGAERVLGALGPRDKDDLTAAQELGRMAFEAKEAAEPELATELARRATQLLEKRRIDRLANSRDRASLYSISAVLYETVLGDRVAALACYDQAAALDPTDIQASRSATRLRRESQIAAQRMVAAEREKRESASLPK